ncbi:MAG: hypothetical protein QOD10_4261 [Mycobacterium sp.]|jgi:hypothetical protein|nr:hypothetical protein [Mycobacterium sp.]
MGFAWGWFARLTWVAASHRTSSKRSNDQTNQEMTMYGIDLDPQTTSDYWAQYLRVMNEAKTH